ncbi:MAG TPA: YfhO family protein, partial [bacterium]|nr:YfhO family protein [bacterium]
PGFFGSYFNNTNWTQGAYSPEFSGFTGFAVMVFTFFAGRKSLGRKGWFFLAVAGLGFILLFGVKTPIGLLFYNVPLFHITLNPGRMFFLWFFGLASASVFASRSVFSEDRYWSKTAGILSVFSIFIGLSIIVFHDLVKDIALGFFHMLFASKMLSGYFFKGMMLHQWSYYSGKISAEVFDPSSKSVMIGCLTLGAALLLGALNGAKNVKLKIALWFILTIISFGYLIPQLSTYAPMERLERQPQYSKWVSENTGTSRYLPHLGWSHELSWPISQEADTIYGNVNLSAGYVHFHPLFSKNYPKWDYDCRYLGTKYLSNRSIADMNHPSCMRGRFVKEFPQAKDSPGEPPVRIYEVAGALPVAYLAPDYLVVKDGAKLMPLLRSRSFDPRRTVAIDDGRDAAEAGIRHGEKPDMKDEAILTRPASNKVMVKTVSAGPRVLVVLDTWLEGWRATVDGRPVGIDRAFGAFKAIPLRSGEHVVKLEYRPVILLKYLPVSLAAWSIILFGLLFTGRKRKRL